MSFEHALSATLSLLLVVFCFAGFMLQANKSAEQTSDAAMFAMLATMVVEFFRLIKFIWGF
jgi:hypothetical protein